MSILAIQSQVACGHVGNAAAVFPLQRLGFEVWPVATVQYSNHPGHGGFRGRAADPDLVADLVAGLAERGVLARCEAVLTGYMGDAALAEAALAAVARTRAANPAALWCCDPVMGDAGTGLYVDPALPDWFRDRAVPRADIVTPNGFELGLLAGRPVATVADALAAARAVRAAGPGIVLCTSLAGTAATDAEVVALAVTDAGAFVVRVPRLTDAPHGAGDLLTALFLGRFLESRDLAAALSLAVSAVHGVIAASLAAGADELVLVAAQDEIVAPSRLFPAEPVS